jgi:hypothetical protein
LHLQANRQLRRHAGAHHIGLPDTGAAPNWSPRGAPSPLGVEREREWPAIIRLPSPPPRS